MQRALELPVVEAQHGERVQRGLDPRHDHRDGGAPELGWIGRGEDPAGHAPALRPDGRLPIPGPMREHGRDFLDERRHVIAAIPVLGNLLAPRQRANRRAESAHLRAGVVDVELAFDLVPVQCEHPRQRVAVGGVAGVTDVHRPGRVGRDELDEDAFAARRPARAEPIAGGESARQPVAQPGAGQEQVKEARPGDLVALKKPTEPALQFGAETLGENTRRGAQRRCEQQRGVGGIVAEAGLGRTFERDRLVPVQL